MKYKCIFSDIDGTLLNSQHQISLLTKQTIKKLAQPFVLVSARMPKSMRTIKQELGIEAPLICYSGGLVLDKANQVIYSQGINRTVTKEIYDFIKSNSSVCQTIYFDDCWMVADLNDPWVKLESEITKIVPTLIDFNKINCAHKLLCMATSKEIDCLEQLLKDNFNNLTIYKSKPTYLEIMDESISKSKAITKLCQLYHYQLEETISFGDNYNDIDMLKATGLGFAMANAPQGVLQQINLHTLSNDEDGIVVALKEYLGEEI